MQAYNPMSLTQNFLLVAGGATFAAVALAKYGSADKIAKLAKKNALNSLRNHQPGTEIIAPPAHELDTFDDEASAT